MLKRNKKTPLIARMRSPTDTDREYQAAPRGEREATKKEPPIKLTETPIPQTPKTFEDGK